MKRFPVLFVFLVTTANTGLAQLQQGPRLEFPLPERIYGAPYTVVPAGEQGLLILNQAYDRIHQQVELHVALLDTTMTQTWKVKLKVAGYLTFATVSNGSLYVLLKSPPGQTLFYSLVKAELKTKIFTSYLINEVVNFTTVDFAIFDEAIYMGGNYNHRPFVFYFSTRTSTGGVLSGLWDQNADYSFMKTTGKGQLTVVLHGSNEERKKSIWIKNYNTERKMTTSSVLISENGKMLQACNVITSGEGQLVAGTYGRGKEFSNGFFTAYIDNDGKSGLTYYNFTDLPNFFNYLPERKALRMQKTIQRHKSRGNETRIKGRFFVNGLMHYGDDFIFMAAEYDRVTEKMAYSYAGPTDGYGTVGTNVINNHFTHTSVVGLSSTGKLLWDNSFEMKGVKSRWITDFVKIHPHHGQIDLVCLDETTLAFKTIRKNEVVQPLAKTPLKTIMRSEYIALEFGYSNHLEYWYPGHFYAEGVQQINNPGVSGAPYTRKVYYTTKITLR